MGDIATTLPACFGLTNVRAVKERGYFLCKTPDIAKIYKTQESHAAIRARYALLMRLAEAGFAAAEKLCLSERGDPYVQLGRETYVMARNAVGRDIDFDCNSDINLVMQTLAHFHNLARDIGLREIPVPENNLPLTEVFAKNSSFLTSALKQTTKNSRISDFDVMFIKNFPKYIDYTARSIELLTNTDYLAVYNTSLAAGHLCHNMLKEESFHIYEDTCFITNFSDAAIDAQVTELASILHRYARRSKREIPICKLVQSYDRISPLPNTGTAIIHAYLMHPWQFEKITRQYYSKKRGWTPAAIMDRMADLLEAQESYDSYIGGLAK